MQISQSHSIMKKFTQAVTLFLLGLSAQAQVGPGGVGDFTQNGLWLKADVISAPTGSAVSRWEDVSGHGNDAIQGDGLRQPIYQETSGLNGQPVVRLDGVDDEMVIADNAMLDNTNGLSYFAVIRPSNLNGSPRGVLGKRIRYGENTNYAYTLFFYSGNKLFSDIVTNDNRYSSPGAFTNNTNYLLGINYDGTRASAQRSRMYSNGALIAETTESATTIMNSTADLVLGALNTNYGTYLGADYAEVIQYAKALNTTETIIVNNYLAAKYGLTLATDDLYTQDDASNGNYDYEVAGIGRVDAGQIHNRAQGSAILSIGNPSNLDDGEFLFWGHNNGAQVATNTTDVPAGVEARFDRVWRFSEVNRSGSMAEVGTLDLTWNLAGTGPVTASDLRLLIDTDGDGSFADETPIGGAVQLTSDLYQFVGVSAIQDGRRMTLGTIDRTQTVLPTKLLYLDAALSSTEEAHIAWGIETTHILDALTLEHSDDAIQWKPLNTYPAVVSKEKVYYNFVHENPVYGNNYYRIRMKERSEQVTYSDIVSVLREGEATIRVYPNPTRQQLTLEGITEADVRLIDLLGHEVGRWTWTQGANIDISDLPAGTYMLIVRQGAQQFVRQIQKQ